MPLIHWVSQPLPNCHIDLYTNHNCGPQSHIKQQPLDTRNRQNFLTGIINLVSAIPPPPSHLITFHVCMCVYDTHTHMHTLINIHTNCVSINYTCMVCRYATETLKNTQTLFQIGSLFVCWLFLKSLLPLGRPLVELMVSGYLAVDLPVAL